MTLINTTLSSIYTFLCYLGKFKSPSVRGTKALSVIICLVVFGLAGCHHPNIVPEGDIEPIENGDFLSTDINGRQFEAEILFAALPDGDSEIRMSAVNPVTNEGISIVLQSPFISENRYELNESYFPSQFVRYVNGHSGLGCDYNLLIDQSVKFSGFLKIEELNHVDRVVKGRFAFDIKSDNCTQTVVDNGHFQIHF